MVMTSMQGLTVLAIIVVIKYCAFLFCHIRYHASDINV